MLTSTKNGAPEKDRNASVSAADVIGRVVQHDQTWAKSEPTKAGMASCCKSPVPISSSPSVRVLTRPVQRLCVTAALSFL